MTDANLSGSVEYDTTPGMSGFLFNYLPWKCLDLPSPIPCPLPPSPSLPFLIHLSVSVLFPQYFPRAELHVLALFQLDSGDFVHRTSTPGQQLIFSRCMAAARETVPTNLIAGLYLTRHSPSRVGGGGTLLPRTEGLLPNIEALGLVGTSWASTY